ncbi:hypothetical protein DFJ73DRAFT_818247 [Zopfochytrium polystomum]|nr:hypothetical protein DFJ73DRAFT_818247 [Zopfochytrium polystomum]
MVPNPFRTATDAALELAKQYYAATDFKPAGEAKGAKLFCKDITDTPVPVTKGEITFVGFTPDQILEKLREPDFRKVWDARFEGAQVIERYDDEGGLVLSNQKGALFVSGRDFSVAFQVYREGDTIFYIQTSVEDPRTPETNGRVRAKLTVGAWILKASANGTDVTYITHANPNGTIPSTLLKMVATDTPACAGALFEAMKKA